MKPIPKPRHCGQKWLDMSPTEGGRICGQCDKRIIDFSKKSWTEIEQVQRRHHNTVCGMYHPKQLEHWGQEVPGCKDSVLKSVAVTGLTVALGLPLQAQNTTYPDSIVIKGKIIDETNKEAIPFASVRLKTGKVAAISDLEGNFKLVVRDVPPRPLPDTLEVFYIGYRKKQLIFKDLKKVHSENSIQSPAFNITLELSEEKVIAFYVTKPTLRQRIAWKFKRWFGSKKS